MPKRLIAILILVCSIHQTYAQYKKASFFNKSGRTYELATNFHFLGKSNATLVGIQYSFGRDKGSQRFFHWGDLELLLGSKFSYTTPTVGLDESQPTEVKVSGKTPIGLIYRYNAGFYLNDITKEDNKILPFLTGGYNIVILGSSLKSYKIDPDVSEDYLKERPNGTVFSLGINLGAGAVYKINKTMGIKLAAGYDLQYNISSNDDSGDSETKIFKYYSSHPYVTLGLRFRIESED